MTEDSDPGMDIEQSADTVTFTIKRTHLNVVMALAVVLAFGSGVGGTWLFLRGGETSSRVSNQSAPAPPPAVVQVSIDGRPFLGPRDAPVTIVEFTDYECPFCGRHFAQTSPQLLSQYDGQVKFVIMNFPLSFHPFAQKAAEAAECAYDQGKFWEYHDTLFRNQQALDTDSLKGYASALGLDTETFETCLDSDAKAQQVLEDFRDGQSYGVSATPTFFINGRRLVGARAISSFQTLIDEALSR